MFKKYLKIRYLINKWTFDPRKEESNSWIIKNTVVIVKRITRNVKIKINKPG